MAWLDQQIQLQHHRNVEAEDVDGDALRPHVPHPLLVVNTSRHGGYLALQEGQGAGGYVRQ